MIIATAGHIDHGKTTLVRALTGVDTDRLPEEKKRGISIDLGFAYWHPDADTTIGFVDVPGHERFIGNMLAGVCGIDFVLLIVAADDGVMPQTREHVAIVNLLSVARGIAVITKSDRVDAQRLDEVGDDVRVLLSATRLAGSPMLTVSAATGAGMDALRAALRAASAGTPRREAQGRHLRFAIDRAFTVAGSGTVVTGTMFGGKVRVGDKAALSPAGFEVRVRGIQKNGRPAQEAAAGERCALNLVGVEMARASRGNWIVAPPAHRPTHRIDARLQLLPTEKRPLRHWTPVRLHIGTANQNARIAIPRAASIAPGASGIAQLVLDEPVNAIHGERFIVRDSAANRTIGGGEVVDPAAPPLRRVNAARDARLAALEQPAPRDALAALLACTPAGVDILALGQTINMPLESLRTIAADCGATILGKARPVALHRTSVELLENRILDALRAFHEKSPQSDGLSIDALRQEAARALGPEPFLELLRGTVQRGQLAISNSMVRLASHAPKQSAEQQKLWDALQPVFDGAGYQVPKLQEIAARTGLKESAVKNVLQAKAKAGDVVRVSEDRFYLQSTLAGLAAIAVSTAQGQRNGEFTVAQYRDRSGVGRNLAIEILECFDRLGITLRVGVARKIRKDYTSILGSAPQAASRPDQYSV